MLAALVVLSIVVPYAWCRYLCPYGALLGVLSLASPLKITRTASNCIDCGLCARACPAVLAAMVFLLFYGGIQVAKLSGYWATDITNEEYRRRIGEIDAPKYDHRRGEVQPYGPGD